MVYGMDEDFKGKSKKYAVRILEEAYRRERSPSGLQEVASIALLGLVLVT